MSGGKLTIYVLTNQPFDRLRANGLIQRFLSYSHTVIPDCAGMTKCDRRMGGAQRNPSTLCSMPKRWVTLRSTHPTENHIEECVLIGLAHTIQKRMLIFNRKWVSASVHSAIQAVLQAFPKKSGLKWGEPRAVCDNPISTEECLVFVPRRGGFIAGRNPACAGMTKCMEAPR